MENKDLYDLLGVPRDANKQDIGKAYRKLASKYHPDKLGDKYSDIDKQKFIDICKAYEILSDEDKKFRYDRFGITDDVMPEEINPMQSLFEMLFKTNIPKQTVEPVVVNVFISLQEVITGTKKTIHFERNVMVDMETNKIISITDIIHTCDKCMGTGSIVILQGNNMIRIQQQVICPICNGNGWININPHRYKIMNKRGKLDYNLVMGTKNHSRVVIPKIGHINLAVPDYPGDVVLHILYETNKTWSIDSTSNIIYTRPVSVFECLTGTILDISHPDGNTYNIKTGRIEPNGKKIIKRLGLPQMSNDGLHYTDIIITFNVLYPDISPNQEKILLENFDEYYHIVNNPVKCSFDFSTNDTLQAA